MVLPMASPWKHPKTGVYYFRRRVPAKFVEQVGRKEVKKSLRTKDPEEARRRFVIEWQRTDDEWLGSVKTLPISNKQISALAGVFYREFVDMLYEEPGETYLWDIFIDKFDESWDLERIRRYYGSTADRLLRRHGLVADEYGRDRLMQRLHETQKLAGRTNRQRSMGNYGPDPYEDSFPELESANPNEKPVTDLFSLLELWASNHRRHGRSERTAKDWERAITEFSRFLKHSDAARITKADVVNWRRHLSEERELSPKTINAKKLAALNSIFSYAVSELRIDNNPAEGVSQKARKPRQERSQGFTQVEAEAILSASLKAEETEAGTAPRTRLAYRWVPWICAYTGARSGEITQLRKEDIFDENIPFIRITPEAGSVKTGQYRDVPLHRHLLEQGFLEFVKGRPDGPLFYDPKASRRWAQGEASATSSPNGFATRLASLTPVSSRTTHGGIASKRSPARSTFLPNTLMRSKDTPMDALVPLTARSR